MKILVQSGKYIFMVFKSDKYFILNTKQRTVQEVEGPDTIYKHGYCVKPNPTKEQVKEIELLIESMV